MMVQSKVQIHQKDYDFIKKVYKSFNYKSLSEYMREAVSQKVMEDRRKFREMKRNAAMEMIGEGKFEDLFESIEGDDLENR